MYIFLTVGAALLVSEIAGYFLHRFLHSGRVLWLSRGHMYHHLKLYPPDKDIQLESSYKSSTVDRSGVHGIGSEWSVPLAILFIIELSILYILKISWPYQVLYFSIGTLYSLITFQYAHDGMHVKGFWFESNAFTRKWFNQARARHSIHHQDINEKGIMGKNYGICFSWLDRMFGTYCATQSTLNTQYLKIARETFKF